MKLQDQLNFLFNVLHIPKSAFARQAGVAGTTAEYCLNGKHEVKAYTRYALQKTITYYLRRCKKFEEERRTTAMRELIELLMNRDGISRLEAENLIHECAHELHTLCDLEDNPQVMYEEACDIVMDYLGLEPDYLDLVISI